MPAPPKPELASKLKRPGKTLRLTSSQLLARLPDADLQAAPLADGTPRDLAKLASAVQIEVIGERSDVSRYTVMFGLPNDNKGMVIEAMTLTARVLMNTFPTWTKPGNSALTWMGDATVRLGKNTERNRENPAPVVMDREGKRIKYSAVPALGIFFLTVEPI